MGMRGNWFHFARVWTVWDVLVPRGIRISFVSNSLYEIGLVAVSLCKSFFGLVGQA